jgi:hypothetical protein
MALTRSELAELDETRMRTRVLIPLFKAMGFRDIEHYHGGSQEHGKDIIMWRPEGLRERVNYGVVVKAKRVSGKASGTSSAGEVRIQIEQCFDKPYPDPIGVPGVLEQLWKAFHNCSYRTTIVMQSMLLQGGSKSLRDQFFRRTQP